MVRAEPSPTTAAVVLVAADPLGVETDLEGSGTDTESSSVVIDVVGRLEMLVEEDNWWERDELEEAGRSVPRRK